MDFSAFISLNLSRVFYRVQLSFLKCLLSSKFCYCRLTVDGLPGRRKKLKWFTAPVIHFLFCTNRLFCYSDIMVNAMLKVGEIQNLRLWLITVFKITISWPLRFSLNFPLRYAIVSNWERTPAPYTLHRVHRPIDLSRVLKVLNWQVPPTPWIVFLLCTTALKMNL